MLTAIAQNLSAAGTPENRRKRLIDMLAERNISFTLQQKNGVINILAGNLETESGKILICAHYDAVSQSSGANDNLSSVSILLHLLEKNPLQFTGAFLDGEETGHTGARLLLERWESEAVQAVIVLDTCGYGNVEAFHIRKGGFHPLFRRLTSKKMKKKYHLQSLPCLMESDDGVLAEWNVPTILISMLPEYDVQALQSAWNYYGLLLQSSASWPQLVQSLEVFQTIHNGPLDCPDVLMEASMRHVLLHLQEALFG